MEESKKSKDEVIEELYEQDRIEILNYIKENITNRINNINEIADVQVSILSQRQNLVDKSAEIRSLLRSKQKSIHSTKKSKYRFYKLEYDLKLTDFEIKNHIEADLEPLTNTLKILENQLLFYKDCIDTIDKSMYMVKYLVETKKFLSGNF